MAALTDHEPSFSEMDEDFISSLHQFSHDLRNRLSVINGFSVLLLMDEKLDPAHAEHVQSILNASKVLDVAIGSYLVRVEAIASSSADLPNVKDTTRDLRRRSLRLAHALAPGDSRACFAARKGGGHFERSRELAGGLRHRPVRRAHDADIASTAPSQGRSCGCRKWLPPYHRRGLRALQCRT